MRETTPRTVFGYLSTQLPRRSLATPGYGTGTLKAYVTATPALSTAEQNVTKAFLALLGRTPDRSGLAYWAAQSSASSVANAINALVTALNGLLVYDPDPGVTAQMLYQNLLGKSYTEDTNGIDYWASVISSTSVGNAAATIIAITESGVGLAADTYRNRQLVLESVCRLQKTYSRDLDLADSRTITARVDAKLAGYESTMDAVSKLLVDNTSSPTNTWEALYTSDSLWTEARSITNSPVKQTRTLVWYNRSGRMMRAVAYLPTNFLTGTHRALISLHGGGWRLGWPEQAEWMSTYLSNLTGQTYVVIAPTYRLTPFGGATTGTEEDVADILALVKSSSFLRCDSTKVGLIGESAGGHLASLIGSTQDVWRVFALYPPMDLTGTPAVSTGLAPYVNYYADTTIKRQNASPQQRWTAARTTKFNLWHGTSDTFVPSSQSTNFDALVGANCDVTLLSGEGHGFSASGKASALSAAGSWFALA